MANLQEVTYKGAGYKKEDMYNLIFPELAKHPDGLVIKDIFQIVNDELAKNSQTLSKQGEQSLRNMLNLGAVSIGFIYPRDKENPKWRLTDEGKRIFEQQGKQEESVIDTITGNVATETTNVAKGMVLEEFVLELLKIMHPHYSWFHQGKYKINERGLDLIASRIGENQTLHKTIGVQIKNHQATSAPAKEEWTKFLAGCFVRRIEEAIFITTGKLTSDQRREAGEAKITVIEGINELDRIAKLYNYKTFDEYNEEDYTG